MNKIQNKLNEIKAEYEKITNKDIETLEIYFKLKNGQTLSCRYEFLIINKNSITLLYGWSKIREQITVNFADIQTVFWQPEVQSSFTDFDNSLC